MSNRFTKLLERYPALLPPARVAGWTVGLGALVALGECLTAATYGEGGAGLFAHLATGAIAHGAALGLGLAVAVAGIGWIDARLPARHPALRWCAAGLAVPATRHWVRPTA